MAMDYLPIQATAVPCERVFSSSAQTSTRRRNRIRPILMEALQMLKFHFKKEHLNFTKNWKTSEKEMKRDEPTPDLLSKLLGSDYQDVLDNAIGSLDDGLDDSDDNE
jgi:hAT family C-terminal dimerisation region